MAKRLSYFQIRVNEQGDRSHLGAIKMSVNFKDGQSPARRNGAHGVTRPTLPNTFNRTPVTDRTHRTHRTQQLLAIGPAFP